jgi:glycosyltransferase involved in cell wall biosynthesis
MPAYNASLFIEEAIQSVNNQTFTDWELIVINDGSTDSTQEIVLKYSAKDSRISLINQENKRLGAARNTGIKAAKSEWITFLDADDVWLPKKLATQFHLIQTKPEVDVFFSNGYTFYESEKIRLYYHFPVYQGMADAKTMYESEMMGNQIPVLSVAVKKIKLVEIGIQDESIEAFGCEDWDYWLRLSLSNAKFYGSKERLFIYRVHSGGMSSKRLVQLKNSAFVLLKNFRNDLLTIDKQKNIKSNLINIANELLENGLSKEGNHLKNEINSKIDVKVFSKKSLTKNRNLGSILKYLIMGFMRVFVFSIYQKLEKHRHNFNIKYHQWKYGIHLQTKGWFYMHPTSKISIVGNANIKFYGCSIYDYSQVNISGKEALLQAGNDFVINKFCHFNIWDGLVKIGNNVLFNNYCSLNCKLEIEIGDNTWFGEGVRIYDHNHQYKNELEVFTSQGFTNKKIKIGSNVWIGANVVILQGVEIGDNSVIGANNLIYKSVEAGSLIKINATRTVEKF